MNVHGNLKLDLHFAIYQSTEKIHLVFKLNYEWVDISWKEKKKTVIVYGGQAVRSSSSNRCARWPWILHPEFHFALLWWITKRGYWNVINLLPIRLRFSHCFSLFMLFFSCFGLFDLEKATHGTNQQWSKSNPTHY